MHFEEQRSLDHGFFSGLAADFCSSSLKQFLEVLPLAERVEGTLGAKQVDVAEAGVDGLSQQGHRLVGVGLSLAADTPVPSCPARPASAAWA